MFKILSNRFIYFVRPGITMFPTRAYDERVLIPISKISRILVISDKIQIDSSNLSYTFSGSSKEEMESTYMALVTAMNGGIPLVFEPEKSTELLSNEEEDKAPPYEPYDDREELASLVALKTPVKDVSLYRPAPDAWAVAQLR